MDREAVSRVGWCVRRGEGHRFLPGSTICTRCEFERPLVEAIEDADARDARLEVLYSEEDA